MLWNECGLCSDMDLDQLSGLFLVSSVTFVFLKLM